MENVGTKIIIALAGFGICAHACNEQPSEKKGKISTQSTQKTQWLERDPGFIKNAVFLDGYRPDLFDFVVFVGDNCEKSLLPDSMRFECDHGDQFGCIGTKPTGVFEGCKPLEFSKELNAYTTLCGSTLFALYDSWNNKGLEAHVLKVVHSKNPVFPKGSGFTLWKTESSCVMNH